MPLENTQMTEAGIQAPYEKSQVHEAPSIDTNGDLNADEEALYTHYQITQGTAGYDTLGPTTDDAMNRSEEEIRVGETLQESGRARLRKYIVTEQVQVEVPLQREVLRMEREPITNDNYDKATDGPALSQEEHEVVLHAEVPVIDKVVVPKERVRMTKEAIQNRQPVFGEVRKEVVEQESDASDEIVPADDTLE